MVFANLIEISPIFARLLYRLEKVKIWFTKFLTLQHITKSVRQTNCHFLDHILSIKDFFSKCDHIHSFLLASISFEVIVLNKTLIPSYKCQCFSYVFHSFFFNGMTFCGKLMLEEVWKTYLTVLLMGRICNKWLKIRFFLQVNTL